MVNKNLISILFIGILCFSMVSAVWYNPFTWFQDPENNTDQNGQLFIVVGDSEWNVLKAIDKEENLTFSAVDQKDKKTSLCWTLQLNKTLNDTSDRYLYDKDDNLILDDKDKEIKLKWENSAQCNGLGFHIDLTEAKAMNIDEFIKLGDNSFVTEYQGINTLNYNLGWSNTNITLYKNISGAYENTINSIWIQYNNDSYKFGANDSSNEDLESYKYQIKSDKEIYLDGWVAYIKNPEMIVTPDYKYYETHEFDFRDICSRYFNGTAADCNFSSYDIFNNDTQAYDYYLEVKFISDMNIDPEITIGSSNWAPTALLINVTAEPGNFTHLDISNDDPYDSLVLYMPFDVNTSGSGHTYDWSSNDNDDAVTGASWNSNGKYGGGFEFDGDGDYITIENNVNTYLNMTQGTISFWYKSSGNTSETAPYFFGFSLSGDDLIIQVFLNTLLFLQHQGDFGGYDAVIASIPSIQTNTDWHHVVARWDVNGIDGGAATLSLTFDNTETNDSDVLTNPSSYSGTAYIASYAGTGNYFNGSIDEYMIFNESLTTQQISDIYNNQSVRFFPKGTQKVRAVNITNSTTWDNNGFDTVNLTSTIQENLDSRIEARIGQFNFSVNTSGLVLYSPYEWGSAVDISGEDNDGTINGATWNETGGVNETGGFSFDGDGDYIDLNTHILNTSEPFTYVAWIKKSIDGTAMEIIFVNSDSSRFRIISSNLLLYRTNSDATFSVGTIAVADGWTHVAVTYNGSAVKMYINGDLDGEEIKSATNTAEDHSISSSSSGYNGSIDEVMMFDRALSSTEISQIYNDSIAKYNTEYYTDYQNITSNTNETFTINTEADFIFPDYKFFAGPNSSNPFYSPIIQDDIILNWFTSAVGDNPPTYSNIVVNSTIAGQSTNFSVQWDDDVALNPNGQYIFSTNNTGTWINDSAINFTTTPSAANIIKTLNSTVGLSVGYRWYATDNASNLNNTGILTLTTTSVTDTSFTVTLPAGTLEAIYSPLNSTAKNVSATNQTDSIPFFNVTNTGNVNLDFNFSINASLPSGIILKGDTDNNPAGAIDINTSSVSIFTGLTAGSSFSIWYWSDFTNAVEQTISRQLNLTTEEA